MAIDRARLLQHELDLFEKIIALGMAEADAEIIASCILTQKPCSWVNNDYVDEQRLDALRGFLHTNNHPIEIHVSLVPTRNKFIWEAKVKK